VRSYLEESTPVGTLLEPLIFGYKKKGVPGGTLALGRACGHFPSLKEHMRRSVRQGVWCSAPLLSLWILASWASSEGTPAMPYALRFRFGASTPEITAACACAS